MRVVALVRGLRASMQALHLFLSFRVVELRWSLCFFVLGLDDFVHNQEEECGHNHQQELVRQGRLMVALGVDIAKEYRGRTGKAGIERR